ncbi:hypothetical protein GCM10028778_17850 [Barrientosiimonas marina]|uniref:Divergent PAP2 family protein n=1 Tax=Lentibacillus kimchii TaxID=1542911 RepID=A0ABW2US30_9BACI
MPYFLAPLIGWLAAGCLKFALNVITYGREAVKHGGNGGFPSTHTATVSSVAFLIGFGEGWLSPAFGAAIGLLMIVMIDATGLRVEVGKQAAAINRLNGVQAGERGGHDASFDQPLQECSGRVEGNSQREIAEQPLRERSGHTRAELAGGLAVGLAVSAVLYGLFSWWGWS